MKRRTILVFVAISLVGMVLYYHLESLNGLPGLMIRIVFGEDTQYSTGYSEERFRAVRPQMTPASVEKLLGRPFGKRWWYHDRQNAHGCSSLYFEHDELISWSYDECDSLGIRTGMTMSDVQQLLQAPDEIVWVYSKSPSSSNYRERIVRFTKGGVRETIARWYFD